MSSHHHLNPPSGEVIHINHLSEDIGALYLADEYSDVTLIVSGQRFNGHRVILAARSQYFRALLFGGLKESMQEEIELKGTTLPAFKELLKYIYTGHLSLANQREEVSYSQGHRDFLLPNGGFASEWKFCFRTTILELSYSGFL